MGRGFKSRNDARVRHGHPPDGEEQPRRDATPAVSLSDQPGRSRARTFPIVGVGASAGGLEAFTQLLKHLPARTGMAFVLVQHLDPVHKSALAALLKRATTIPVCEVTDNLPVEPDHIYIIPPNVNLAIAGGVLRLSARGETRGANRSIDFFLQSLAADRGDRAIGVILSGTANDGTLGLEAIKAEGGITFAQDDSAKYDSMPRSAAAAGCVDFVLSPERIANELAQIASHPYLSARGRTRADGVEPPAPDGVEEPDRRDEENGLRQILLLLRNQSGVDFSLYKTTTIRRRITRRIVLNKQGSFKEYARFLKGNVSELESLYSDVLIGVTEFFRNPEAFSMLKRKVLPELLTPRRTDPVRVWVVGCSTGQEAYSIAMCYAEHTESRARVPKLQVFATDLNDGLLDRARHGLYPRTLAGDISPERLRRFFVEEEGGYRVSKSLRDQVVFARQNLISDPPFSRMDLISCRNLMIYLEPGLQKKILPSFHYALNPGGCLFLGASESIGQFTELFDPADKKHKIFVKKAAAQTSHVPMATRRAPAPLHRTARHAPGQPATEPAGGLSPELGAQREADRLTVGRFAPPGVLINAEFQVLQFRGSTGEYLEPPKGQASFHLLKMAREGLMLPLRAAINKARRENKPVRRQNIRVARAGGRRTVNLEVIPLKNLKDRMYLVLFEPARTKQAGEVTPPVPPPERPGRRAESRRIMELEREISETRDYLQSIQEQHEASNEELQASNEELQASNEEVQSGNEELQSINEELETSKEELESTNEELTTVNEEMANRNAELSRANADLVNLHVSINTPLLLLARDLTIRRFTPQAEKVFNLLPADIGRSLGGIKHNLDLPTLEELVRDVVDTVRMRECEVRDKDGRWHSLRVRPYLTLDNKIDGAVLLLSDIDALKRSEEAAKAAREYAEATIRTARDPLVVLRGDLRVNSANDAFYKMTGATPAQAEGRPLGELGGGAWNVPKLHKLLTEILPRNSFFNDFEIVHDFPGRGRRTLLLNARRLDTRAGAPEMILLSIEDVTERLETREALRQSELRYRRLFEAAQDGILVLDPATQTITQANPFVMELLGRTHEELLGRKLWEIGLFKDEPAVEAFFRELDRGQLVRHEDLPVRTKTGASHIVEIVANPYSEQDQRTIQCNVRDVTWRKQAESASRQLAAIVESSDDAIITKDLVGTITTWNAGAERLYGFTAEEMVGKPDSILIPPQRFKEEVALLERIRQSERVEHYETVRRHKDGRLLDVSLTISPLKDAQGRIVGASKIARDITHRKQDEAALRLAREQLADRASHLEQAVAARTMELNATNKQLESFVYSIAHDLRAPLRAMEGFASMLLLEEGEGLSETGRDFAGRISRSAKFMDALLTDLLAFSRVSQEQIQLGPAGLETVVHAAVSRLEQEIQEKGARVETPGPWPAVLAHEPILAQVVFNLASNALKFTRPDVPPLMRIFTEERGSNVRVWVEDNGIGIAPESHERIFRLFIRLQGDKFSGTGVGLAIVQKGVERMGGHVGVESAPGQGSRFWFELPKA